MGFFRTAAEWATCTFAATGTRNGVGQLGLSHDFTATTGLVYHSGDTIANSAVIGAVDAFVSHWAGSAYYGVEATVDSLGSLGNVTLYVEADLAWNGNGGINALFVFRDNGLAGASRNYYYVVYDVSSVLFKLVRGTGGVETVLATASQTITTPATVRYKIALSGSAITFTELVTGATMSATDSTQLTGKVLVLPGIGGGVSQNGLTAWGYVAVDDGSLSGTITTPALDLSTTSQQVFLGWAETLGGGDVTVDLQDSTDGSTGWASVSGATGLTDPSGVIKTIPKRYVRAVITLSRTLTTQTPQITSLALLKTTAGIADTTPPAAPTLTYVSSAAGSVTLTLTVPGSDHSYTLIQYDLGPGTTVTDSAQHMTSGDKTISGLTAGGLYRFAAVAFDAAGNKSTRSPIVLATPGGGPVGRGGALNVWQLARQLRYLLAARTWTGGGEAVFASVHVTAGPTEAAEAELRPPFALVRVLAAEADAEDPRLLRQRFELVLAVAVAGDAIGERALTGGPRSAGQASSRGRGLLEVEEEALDALVKLAEGSGVGLQARGRGAVEAALVEPLGYVATRTYELEAWCGTLRFYHPPLRLAASASGGGQVALSWTLPPDRFDRLKVVLRRAAGATPPASATAGTGVTLSGNLATSVTDTPGAGQVSYALFGAYDETGGGTAERYSAAATATVTAT